MSTVGWTLDSLSQVSCSPTLRGVSLDWPPLLWKQPSCPCLVKESGWSLYSRAAALAASETVDKLLPIPPSANIATSSIRTLLAPAIFRNAIIPRPLLNVRFSSSSAVPKPSRLNRPQPSAKPPKSPVEEICSKLAAKLADNQPAAAAAIVHRALDGRAFNNAPRFQLYERSILYLLRYGDVMRAALLYSRMTREGYIPSVALRIQMHIVKLAELSMTEDQLLEILSDAFKNPAFDEAGLQDVLHTLVEGLNVSTDLVRRIVQRFLETREPDYKLSNGTITFLLHVHRKAGDDSGAEYWSTYSSPSPRPPPSPAEEPLDPVLHPYTTLLEDLTTSQPTFSVYKWALEHTLAEDVEPDLPFFNALLAHEVSRRKYDVVFEIYRLLMAKRTAAVRPHAQTFAPIFRALHRLSCSHRYRRMHGIRVPERTPSARSVYRDMLTCHVEETHGKPNTPSPVLDRTVLHRALRTFMAQHDYAAAYTAVRAFWYFPAALGQPSMTTYRLVYGSLLGRIRLQFPHIGARLQAGLKPDNIWSYRFLGMQDLSADVQGRLCLDLSMVHRVLRVGTDPRLSVDFIAAPNYAGEVNEVERLRSLLGDFSFLEDREIDPHEFHAHKMPAPLELAGAKAVPENQTYSVVPLERVLRRAMAASLPDTYGALVKPVSAAIVEAKEAMVVEW
ncbi:hypothetical protein PYCCODRAFT_1478131 [Trametes coccinea BRFM310]|uniref:Uncharacterized protein n=1 Tax=Trametes coccinea (strain BRFM310) TaxID=1353009 RepID=A0A1Y2IP05_TRAC3|nr:hypothetical protein PYCCODRAFT_1478131 [Trametes coccinea BRFM310]